jgi:hypothetical protein
MIRDSRIAVTWDEISVSPGVYAGKQWVKRALIMALLKVPNATRRTENIM